MSWKIRTLNSVASVFNGKTPSRSEQRGLGHPVLKIKDIDASRNFSGLFESYVDENLAEKFEDKKLQLHDSLILNAAHNSDYVGSKQYRAEQSVVGSLPTGEWLIVRANQNELDAKFLNYCLSTPNAKYQIKQLVKGIHLYPKDVARLQIPLPPMPEQKRISVILDKADAICRKRHQAIKLAEEFLRAVFLDMFGDPVTNPKGWVIKPLSELVSKLGDGLHGTPEYDNAGEYCFINGNNLDSGRISINGNVKRVSTEEFKKHKKELNENTILVSINGTIGKIAFYNGEKVVLGKSACYFNILPNLISPYYLYHLIQSHYFLNYTNSRETGSTIKNVSLKSMREFPVPLPPMDIQNQFNILLRKTEAVKANLLASNENTKLLFNSISTKFFNQEVKV